MEFVRYYCNNKRNAHQKKPFNSNLSQLNRFFDFTLTQYPNNLTCYRIFPTQKTKATFFYPIFLAFGTFNFSSILGQSELQFIELFVYLLFQENFWEKVLEMLKFRERLKSISFTCQIAGGFTWAVEHVAFIKWTISAFQTLIQNTVSALGIVFKFLA